MTNAQLAAVGWRHWLVNLPRGPKRILLIFNDFCLLTLGLWLSFTVRLSMVYVPPSIEFGLLLMAAPAIGVAIFSYMGLYRLVTRYMGQQGSVRILVAIVLTVLSWSLVVVMSGITGVPRSIFIIFGIFAMFFIWSSRQFAGWLLCGIPNITLARFDSERDNVLIYGAGITGIQLLDALKQGSDYKAVGFVDENRSLWGQTVNGLKVYKPGKIGRLIELRGIKHVFLTISDLPARQTRTIIRGLEPYPVSVKTLPCMNDIASGRVQISDLRPVDVQDLLGRDSVPPDPDLLQHNIRGKSVLVTGAGGSIGSELCRRILALAPRRLVIYDVSEAALYEIELELSELHQKLPTGVSRRGEAVQEIELVPILGSVLDSRLVEATLRNYQIQTIYHAAAYKHVTLVQQNPVAGLLNNTFGTILIAKAARDHGVERFVLISTDKAVRPTNIMGASKRLAELVIQAEAQNSPSTVYSIVRFGNVLDSSGSVIGRFRKQIHGGGPVTVTHREVNRFFMSISEAAELVLQAGAMAKGGEVFVLDMGQPVKIDDLARSMIRLMGLEVQDDANPNGGIPIEYIGLRNGEKLHEELLIGDNTMGTKHPRIKIHLEPIYPSALLAAELNKLKDALDRFQPHTINNVLQRIVEGYVPDKWTLQQTGTTSERLVPVRQTLH